MSIFPSARAATLTPRRFVAVALVAALTIAGLMSAPAAQAATGGSITGTVKSAVGTLDGPLTATLSNRANGVGDYVTVSSQFVSAGSFAFNDLPDSTGYRLVVTGGTYMPETALTYIWNGQTLPLALTMHRPLTITGHASARNSQGETSLVNVSAYLKPTDPNYTNWGVPTSGYASTDQYGYYSLTVPADGTYRLRFSASGFTPQWYNGVDAITDRAADVVGAVDLTSSLATSGVISGADATLHLGHSISGTVTEAGVAGQGIQSIYLRSTTAPFPMLTQTGALSNGNYQFNGVPDGNYLVEFVGNYDWRGELYNNVDATDFSHAQRVTVSGSNVANISGDLAARVHYSIGGSLYAGSASTTPITNQATVYLYAANASSTAPAVRTVFTSNGSYSFTDIDPGSYKVKFQVNANMGGTEYFPQWYNATNSYSIADATVVTVGADPAQPVATTGIDAHLKVRTPLSVSGTASVSSGTASVSSGTAPALYTVQLQFKNNTESNWQLLRTMSTTTGAYTFSDVPSTELASLRLVVDAGNHFSTAVVPVPLAFDSLTGVDAQLTPQQTHTITGSVLTSATAASVEVRAYAQLGGQWTPVATATPVGGRYSLEVGPGDYRIAFYDNARILKTQWFDGVNASITAPPSNAAPVVVTDANVSGINAQLVPYPTVSGVVRDTQGRPLADTSVQLYVWRTTPYAGFTYVSSGTTETDANGRYSLTDLETGKSYTIGFYPPTASASTGAYLDGLTAEPASQTGPGTFVFQDSSLTKDVTLPDAPRYTGSVTSLGGGGVPGASVEWLLWTGSSWQSDTTVTTDAVGNWVRPFRFTGQTFTLKVSKPGFTDAYLGGGTSVPSAPTASNSVTTDGASHIVPALQIVPVPTTPTVPEPTVVPLPAPTAPQTVPQPTSPQTTTDSPPPPAPVVTLPAPVVSTPAVVTPPAATAPMSVFVPLTPVPTVTVAAPVTAGTATVGKILTAKVSKKLAGTALKYQWYANGKAIKKATKASFKLTASQKGKKITVKVTGTKKGYGPSVKTSKPTAKVK